MSVALFALGLLTGAAAFGIVLVPRLRRAIDSARVASEAERAASIELKAAAERHHTELEAARMQAVRDAEHAARLAGEREVAHERPSR